MHAIQPKTSAAQMGDEMSGADRTPRSAAVAEAASVASTGKLMVVYT